jgi:ADP-heptose:LPS heptosyltransferase
VVIQPGSGGTHKCWHIDNFLAVAKELSLRGIQAVFLLGPAEMDRFSDTAIKGIDKIAKTLKNPPLVDVLGLLSCSAGYLGNDSGITHLAAALGVKTIVVFGPTDPALYAPIGPKVKVFTDNSKTFATTPSQKLRRQILTALT